MPAINILSNIPKIKRRVSCDTYNNILLKRSTKVKRVSKREQNKQRMRIINQYTNNKLSEFNIVNRLSLTIYRYGLFAVF